MISNPETVSINVVCFICSSFTDFSIIVYKGLCKYQEISKDKTTVAMVMYARGPAIKNITIIKIITNNTYEVEKI